MIEYELTPVYDSRKSFYGKAKVKSDETSTKLYSYNKLVAEIRYNEKGRMAIVYGTYSQTTLRHIKEFLKQKSFVAVNKAQIERDYMNREKLKEVL